MDFQKFIQGAQQLEETAAVKRRSLSESLQRDLAAALERDDHALACAFLESFLERQPLAGKWWHELALLRHHAGDDDGALAAWKQALATNPESAALLHAIGRAIATAGYNPIEVGESAWGARELLASGGHTRKRLLTFREARWSVLGDDWAEVLPVFTKAMQAQPGDPQTCHNLAYAFAHLGLPGQAQCARALHSLARGDASQALTAFETAPPTDATSELFLADYLRALRVTGKEERAVEIAQGLAPQAVPPLARTEWAHALVDLDREHEGIQVLLEGSALLDEPGLAIQAETLLPPVPKSQAAMDRAHQRVRLNMLALDSRPLPAETEALDRLARSLRPSFLLAYMGDACVEESQAYARYTQRVIHTRYPQFATPIAPRVRLGASGRGLDDLVRIGFATSFVNHHVVMKSFVEWLRRRDRGAFETHIFPLATERNEVTGYLAKLVDVFHPAVDDTKEAARQIREAGLDLLVYPEIGMDSLSYRLAAMRLAPVQCAAGGHPITTGLPTIDYFLSAAAAEPADAASHYSERLVTLPGMGICMAPFAPPANGKTRADFGVAEDRVVYLSTQSLFKYHPDHDDLYARIAESVDKSVFLFVEGSFPAWTRAFVRRLRQSFANRNLDLDDFVQFIPRHDYRGFLALNAISDVFLDPPGGFSGGMTIRDALACKLPVITMPGALMRTRQGLGLLTELGVPETVATDVDEYVRLAVELGNDRTRRAMLSQRISEQRHLLFNDDRCVAGLSAFFRWAAGAPQDNDQKLFGLDSAPITATDSRIRRRVAGQAAASIAQHSRSRSDG